MNLIIDIGNTLVKLSVFNGPHQHDKISLPGNDAEIINWLDKHICNVDACIIASVSSLPQPLAHYLHQKAIQPVIFSSQTPIPIQSNYESMQTLGIDRLAGVIGANYLYPQQNCLVFDMGTAITCDLVTSDGIYEGGSISPGLQMRFKALHQMTSRLPQLDYSTDYRIPAKNTHEAIHAGVAEGIVYELNGTIEHFKNIYEHLAVILTGGDAQYFENSIKSPIFVVSNLINIGLNYILQYNAKNN